MHHLRQLRYVLFALNVIIVQTNPATIQTSGLSLAGVGLKTNHTLQLLVGPVPNDLPLDAETVIVRFNFVPKPSEQINRVFTATALLGSATALITFKDFDKTFFVPAGIAAAAVIALWLRQEETPKAPTPDQKHDANSEHDPKDEQSENQKEEPKLKPQAPKNLTTQANKSA